MHAIRSPAQIFFTYSIKFRKDGADRYIEYTLHKKSVYQGRVSAVVCRCRLYVPHYIYGKEGCQREVKLRVSALGDRPASHIYIKNK